MEKINWKDYIFNAENSKTWKPIVDEHFLDHLIPTLAAIPLQRNDAGKISATRTFQHIPEKLKTPNGIMDGADVKRMLGFLYLMPRSKLLKRSQGKDPRLGSLTPLPMYAHKLHNNVQYEDWQKSDPYIKYFLGSFLESVAQIKPENIPMGLTREELLEHRIPALEYHSGPKAGTSARLTDYKCNLVRFRTPREEDDEDYAPDNRYIDFPLPKPVMFMLLQLWIANVALRKPDIMILDPKNWDATPKALDVESVVKHPWDTPPSAAAAKNPWDTPSSPEKATDVSPWT